MEVGELIASSKPASDSYTEPYGEDRAQDNSMQATPTGQHHLPDTNNTVHSNEHSDDFLQLYKQLSLSTEESHVFVSSYICHHNLTGQACENIMVYTDIIL